MNRRNFSKLSLLGAFQLGGLEKLVEATPPATEARRDSVETTSSDPSWPRLSEDYRQYCFDFNWVDKLTKHVTPLSDYTHLSVPNQVQDLLTINANGLQVFTMSISGYMFYNSRVGVRHPTLKFDYLKEMVQLGHQKGIAMELYLPTIWADYLIHQHPAWGMRNPDGSLFTAAYGGYHPDPNSPAAEWYVAVIHELVPAYHGDALFADGISFLQYGQSVYTVKKFKQEMGRDYPTSLENDPDWRATLRWEIGQVENYWAKLKNAAKERNPEIQVTFNGPGPNIAMPGSGEGIGFVPEPPHLCSQADYAFTEAGSTGEYADWTKGVSHPKPFRVTFKDPFSILDPFNLGNIQARVGRTLAIGGMPFRYDRTSVNGVPNRHFVDTWGQVYKEVKEKEPYLKGAESSKYVGVVSSEPTMFYRGRSDRGCHANDMLGALRMLGALHIQHEVIADWNIRPEFLKPYSAIILPNVGCMPEEQAEALRQYVKDGGNLISTAETSFFRKDGNPRQEFALAEVFGVRLDEALSNAIVTENSHEPSYVSPAFYINPSHLTHPIFRTLPATALIVPGKATLVKAADAQPTAPLIKDAGTPMNSPGSATNRAAVQVHRYGNGMSIYVAGSIFAQSAWFGEGTEGIRWAGPFVKAMIGFLAPHAPWTLNASEKIWAGLNVQHHLKRHVLHLVNWQTDLPSRDVEVTISDGFGVGEKGAQVWPIRRSLPASYIHGARKYVVPEVGPHVMLVFE